jgi:hypothetical protein
MDVEMGRVCNMHGEVGNVLKFCFKILKGKEQSCGLCVGAIKY